MKVMKPWISEQLRKQESHVITRFKLIKVVSPGIPEQLREQESHEL